MGHSILANKRGQYRRLACLLAAGVISTALPAKDLVDPTRPSYVSSGDPAYLKNLRGKYRLSSLLVGDQRKLAVINGRRVGEGDWVGSAMVKSIGDRSVTLIVQNERIKLALSENDIKKRR